MAINTVQVSTFNGLDGGNPSEILSTISNTTFNTTQNFYREIKTHYNLRNPKGDKPTMVYFVCFVNKKQLRISTGYKVYPKQWNRIQAITSSLLPTLDNVNNTILNNKIDEMNVRFSEYIEYICNNNIEISYEAMKRYMTKKEKEDRIDIADILKGYLDNDESIKPTTKNSYFSSIDKFGIYISTLDIKRYEDITLEVMKGFQKWCIENIKGSKGRPSSETVNKIISRLYTVIGKYLVNNGLMKGSHYKDIEVSPLKETKIDDEIALRDDEITMLYNYKCKTKRDEEIKDLFLMECTTGQRFSDIDKVDKLIERKDERTYMNLVQEKTGEKLEVDIIFQMALSILNKYNDKLPTVGRKQFNKRIKEIAKEAGINGIVQQRYEEANVAGVKVEEKERYNCISSHTGRRTFVTMLSLRGMQINEIKRYSGHSSNIIELYDKSKKGTKAKTMFDRLCKEHPELILKMVGDNNNVTSNIDLEQFAKVFAKQESEHKEEVDKLKKEHKEDIGKIEKAHKEELFVASEDAKTDKWNECLDTVELLRNKGFSKEEIEEYYHRKGVHPKWDIPLIAIKKQNNH